MFNRKVKKYVFKNPDRIINIVALIFSISSLIFAVIVWKYPEPIPTFIIIRDYLIIFSLILIVITLITRRTYLRYRFLRNVSHWVEYYDHAQVMLSGYKEIVFDYGYDAVQQSKGWPSSEELSRFRTLCDQVTSGAREALKRYIHLKGIDIGEDVSITVKLIVRTSEIEQIDLLDQPTRFSAREKEQWVITSFRDSYVYNNKPDRRKNDTNSLYDLSLNTAFHDILVVRQPYYFCNNLKALGEKYHNESKEWKKYYNATLVVPIKCERTGRDESMYFGFLAADSLNSDDEEIYDTKGCLIIMKHAADMLANFFMLLSFYNYQPVKEGYSEPSSTISATG